MSSPDFSDQIKLWCVSHFFKLGGLFISATLTIGFLIGYSANRGLEGRVALLEQESNGMRDDLRIIENTMQTLKAMATARGDREIQEILQENKKLLEERRTNDKK